MEAAAARFAHDRAAVFDVLITLTSDDLARYDEIETARPY